jgi:hypothetical protein
MTDGGHGARALAFKLFPAARARIYTMKGRGCERASTAAGA